MPSLSGLNIYFINFFYVQEQKSINLADVSEADIEAEAAVCNRLSELWRNDVFDENEEINIAQMNVLMLLCHALEIIANQK